VGALAIMGKQNLITTLSEAILEHGGEATTARNAFATLSPSSQEAMIVFLNNLKLFLGEE